MENRSELKKKSIASLIWVFTNQFGVQLITFIVSTLLARILEPADFGLIGMMALFIALGNSLVDSGMSSSLIRTKDPVESDYSTVFFMNLILSVFAYALMFFIAPLVADFFGQEILIKLIRVNSLVFIISAFSTVQSTKLNKELQFKKQLMLNIPSLIIGSLVGIYLALNGFGVWSLVWMNIAYKTAATIQLWIYARWAPIFEFDKKKLQKHWSFGYKLTLSGLMDTFVNNIYNIIIGKFFPVSQLGFFTKAKSIQELPVTNISATLNKVTYPVFAIIKDDNEKLKEVYLRLIQQVFFWITPLMLVAIVIAEPLFRFLLTEKWLPSVPYFQVLCIAGIVMPLNTYNLNILLVKGDSAKYLKLKLYRNILMVIGTLLIVPFGIFGLLWSIVIVNVITFFINSHYSGNMIKMTIGSQIKKIAPIFLLSLTVFIITYAASRYINERVSFDLVKIIIPTLIAFSIYIISSIYFKIPPIMELKLMLKPKK